MKRREFESLARRHLDEVLNRRGFVLRPRPPPDHEDAHPRAIYADDPEDYARRYPTLGPWRGREVAVIDIEITLDPDTGRLDCDLDGDPLSLLLADSGATGQADQLTQPVTDDLARQLDAVAAALGQVLDTHASNQSH